MIYVLAIDLGTSGCRSAVFDSKLRIHSMGRREYGWKTVGKLGIESDAHTWWECVIEASRDAIRRMCETDPLAGENIRAISISSQGISPVLLGMDGEVMEPVLNWMDLRSEQEVAQLERNPGREYLYQLTGKIISSCYTLPKLLYLKRTRQDAWKNLKKVLLPMDYLIYQMTGTAVTDHTMASGSMLYDLKTLGWSSELTKMTSLDLEQLPPVKTAGEIAGTLLPAIAQKMGLRGDTIVAVGGQDQKCAAYGAGLSGNAATVSLGTATCITALMKELKMDPEGRLPVFSSLEKDRWECEGVISTSGAALEWFRSRFMNGMDYEELNRRIEAVAADDVMFYPYLSGSASPYWSSMKGRFSGLTLGTDAVMCARAIMEGIAWNIRMNMDAMAEIRGDIDQLYVFGGGSRSDIWMKIIAAITSREVVRLASEETALAGAARLAFKSLGMEIGPVPEGDHFAVSKDLQTVYENKYAAYLQGLE